LNITSEKSSGFVKMRSSDYTQSGTLEMRPNDEATKEHIEMLEAQLLEMEVENKLLKEELEAVKTQLMQMVVDRTFLVA
jgi:hypothetical protein